MDADNVSRRRVMQGVGMMTGVGVTGSQGKSRRPGAAGEPSEQPDGTEPEPGPQTAWPQLGGSGANAGYRRGAQGPKSTITFRWQVAGSSRLSDVVVDDSIVYASDAGVLYALSAADGSTRWTVGTDRSLRRVSAPAVDSGRVYVGCIPSESGCDSSTTGASDAGGFDSHVRAVDGETGTEAWRFEPAQSVAMFHTPTVADGIVYTVGQNAGGGTVGRLYALDGENGESLWSHDTGRSEINGYDAPPVAATDGVVYLAADELVALDAETGAVHWSVDPDTTYKASGANAPAVADERLYIGRGTDTATTFEARSITDGSLAWTHTVTEERATHTRNTEAKPLTGAWTAPAVVDGSVYVGFNERSPRTERTSVVVALRSGTGTVRWRTTFTDDRHTVHAPAATEETLYTGGTALDLDDGAVRWRLDAPPTRRVDTFAPPAIADETVFVGGTSLRAITGQS